MELVAVIDDYLIADFSRENSNRVAEMINKHVPYYSTRANSRWSNIDYGGVHVRYRLCEKCGEVYCERFGKDYIYTSTTHNSSCPPEYSMTVIDTIGRLTRYFFARKLKCLRGGK
nr:hypothetical protein K-LCC10_0288 [Kaumoebavirus]